MMSTRLVELTELLDAYVAEHAGAKRDPRGRDLTILQSGGPADVPFTMTPERSLARPAELFLEALRRHGFRLIDEEA